MNRMSQNCDVCALLWRKYADATAAHIEAEKVQASDAIVAALLAARQKAQEAIRQHEMVDHLGK